MKTLAIAVGLVLVPSLVFAGGGIDPKGYTLTNYNTNVGVNTQGQAQGQKQKQTQGQFQGQGQKQDASNDGNHQKIEGTSFDRYAPTVVAPSLTSGGIGICLGSFSAGLTGPMAGIAFGKTTTDTGCERARDSMILFNMGFKSAGLRVLSGASIKEALEAEGLMPLVSSKAVSTAPTPVTVGAEQIFSEVGPSAAQLVQGN